MVSSNQTNKGFKMANSTQVSHLNEISSELYVSALDNPNISIHMAFDYISGYRTLENIQKEVDSLNQKNGFIPILKNETLQDRLEQIAWLFEDFLLSEGSFALNIEDFSLSTKNMTVAYFKMSLPQYRLRDPINQEEIDVCVRFVENPNIQDICDHVLKLKLDSNIFGTEYRASVEAFARTICWTGSNVGRGLVLGK